MNQQISATERQQAILLYHLGDNSYPDKLSAFIAGYKIGILVSKADGNAFNEAINPTKTKQETDL